MDFNCRDLVAAGFECCHFCHITDNNGCDTTFKIRIVVDDRTHYISLCCKAREALCLDLTDRDEVYGILTQLVIEYLAQLHPVVEERIQIGGNKDV